MPNSQPHTIFRGQYLHYVDYKFQKEIVFDIFQSYMPNHHKSTPGTGKHTYMLYVYLAYQLNLFVLYQYQCSLLTAVSKLKFISMSLHKYNDKSIQIYIYLSNHLLNEFGCVKCVCLYEFAMPKHLAHNVFFIFTLPRAKQYLAQQCQRQQHRRFKYAEQIFHHFKCHHLNGMNKIFFEN